MGDGTFGLIIILSILSIVTGSLNSVEINQKELTSITTECKSGIYSMEVNQGFKFSNKIILSCKDGTEINLNGGK